MKEKLHTNIAVELTGEAPAVKTYGGILVSNKDSVEVRCLPGDLISEITVDVNELKEINDAIHVKDLTVPAGIEVLEDPEDIVVTVVPQRVEKEEPQAEAVEGAEGEAEAKKDEGGEKAEKTDEKKESGEAKS